jgi:hypothetical protein
MATTSSVPTVRARLVTLLEAALPTTQISYGHPGEAMDRESVFLGQARGSHTLATVRAGRRTRDEEYTIDVWVATTAAGPTPQEASERAWTLAAALEDICANDATLGLAGVIWARVDDWSDTPTFDDERRGWATTLRIGIAVRSRLT